MNLKNSHARRKTNRRPSVLIYEAVRWISVVLVVVFIVAQLSNGRESATDIAVMTEKVIAAADTSNMNEADRQMIKRLYGLDPDSYEGITLYYPVTNMGAEEILIVKLKSISQQDAVKTAIDARINTQLGNFEGYGVEQTAMLESSRTVIEGNYILLVVAADPAPIVSAFTDNL